MASVEYEEWVDDDAHDLFWDTWEDKTGWQLLSSEHDSQVYRLASYVVKIRTHGGITGPFCHECIRREYEVGVLINRLQTLTLASTIGYVEFKDRACIITEYVEGLDLWSFMWTALKSGDDTRVAEAGTIYAMLLWELRGLYQRAGFTHYDLHFGNVIVQDMGSSHRFVYTSDRKRYAYTSRYRPIVIDFGRSYVDGIKPSWYEAGMISVTTTPGISDPYIDLVFIVSNLVSLGWYSLDNPLIEMLLSDGHLVEEDDQIGVNWRRVDGWLAPIIPGGKSWATNVSNGITVQETITEFCQYLVDEALAAGRSLEEIDYNSDLEPDMSPREVLLFRAMTAEGYGLMNLSPAVQERYIKQLGESLVYDKTQASSPQYSPASLFNVILGVEG